MSESSFIGIILCGAACWPEHMLTPWDAEGKGKKKPFELFGITVTSCRASQKKTVTTIVQYLAVVFNFLLSFHSFFIRIKIKFNF